eukprot:TRINITY_DN7710_c0_g1_i12.p3 TRINITY_DN7710_c0_g1~~TRINITY_DN7710_c0_g1_i12.p3  ORF type:complete len:200 (+),score=-12.45 TRINITY_DN7710_c0_g1_i12:1987-2586(+)
MIIYIRQLNYTINTVQILLGKTQKIYYHSFSKKQQEPFKTKQNSNKIQQAFYHTLESFGANGTISMFKNYLLKIFQINNLFNTLIITLLLLLLQLSSKIDNIFLYYFQIDNTVTQSCKSLRQYTGSINRVGCHSLKQHKQIIKQNKTQLFIVIQQYQNLTRNIYYNLNIYLEIMKYKAFKSTFNTTLKYKNRNKTHLYI